MLPNYTAEMQYRDFSDIVAQYKIKPVSWSWHAIGGCDTALLKLDVPITNSWDALNWLRRPITIYTGNQAVWWGYIHEITAEAGGLRVGASLDSLYNSVAVAYNVITSGGSGTRLTTAYSTDSVSSDEYGTKEMLASISQATTTQAGAYRDDLLTMHKWPQATVEQGGNDMPLIEIHCRGWWHTLDWQHYTLDDYDAVSTTTQIDTIVTAKGEFITDVEVFDTMSLTTVEYRDGDDTVLTIVNELLATGIDNRRLLATVTPLRELTIEEQPAETKTDEFIIRQGQPVRRIGNTINGHNVAGKWMDVDEFARSFYYMTSPSPVFIEWAEYNVDTNSYRWTPRGAQSALNIR